MTQVLLAVDFEFDLILFELLSEIDDVSIVARPADDVELLALCRTGDADVAIVGEYFPGLDAEVIAAVSAAGVKVLGFGGDAANLTALGMSASVSSTADAATIAQAIDDVRDSTVVPPRPSVPPGAREGVGTIVTVWGTGSAPGRTLTAVNLGDHGARQGHRSVVVDADTVSAMVATTLGLTEESAHLASLCRLEAEKSPVLDLSSLPHAAIREDFHAITGLTRPERWPEIRGSVLAAVLARLVKMFDLVVVDVSDRVDPDDDLADPFYDRHCATRAALDAADVVVVLAAGNPIGLQRLVKLLGTERAEAMREKTRIGITKVRSGAVGHPAEARIREVLHRFVKVEPDFLFSDDRATADAAMLAGHTLHEENPKSVLSQEIAEAVGQLLPGRKRARSGPGRRRSRLG
ncbi:MULTISPECIES: DNA-binding response regulator [unclassified Brevibacterium]|uniref:DNA-binding response regulator n=1 Tax=unclassified Brevibacterium TaxID=2614124 RepID=UPI001E50A548|nr:MULTISPECIES: DNA-binding response regulator [unclassified Brevibacterium]MCD1284459.1 chromosome partitioning protein [Brevibacterium sp. CCUG 69071]MDK8435925.1 DNA-binding response regulator [Brevibacterium sp. H-BE7]